MKKIVSRWLCAALLLGTSAFTTQAYAEGGSVVINEIMASNIDSYWSPAVNFDGWIELYNGSEEPLHLAGCYLSDDKNNLKKWQMPADMGYVRVSGYRQIWFDHYEDNPVACTFKLDCDGGTLYLSDPDGNLILKQKYPEAKSGFSYARIEDGGAEWAWTETPTPNKTNKGKIYCTEQCPAPEVPDGCLFTDTYTLEVPVPEGYILRYTTDGSTPSASNGLKVSATTKAATFTSKITANKAFRFRLCKTGMLSSEVVTRSFLKKEGFTLPIISITTKDIYLYDATIGCTVQGDGTYGKSGNGKSYIANWNMDWSRPVNFQYMDKDGNMLFNQDVNYKVAGGYTRSYNQAFKLKGSKKYYGRKYLEYPFFNAKPDLRNQCLLFRRGGNDTSSRIADAAMQVLAQASGIDVDLQSYQPAIYYINGVRKGLCNIREPNNRDFANANFGYEEEELEIYDQSLDHGGYMMLGTFDVFNLITELCKNADDEETYQRIKTYLDIDEYSNYLIQGMWTGRVDWPINNVKFYRQTPNGRFRAVVYDIEQLFATTDVFERQRKAEYNRTTPDHMYWLWGLLKNEGFRRRFAANFSVMGGSVYHPNHCNAILDSLKALVSANMSKAEGKTPDSKLNSFKSTLTSWDATMTAKMKACPEMKLTDVPAQKVKLRCDNPQGRILIEGIPLPYNDFNGTLYSPVTLKAEARGGLKFKCWKETCTPTTTYIKLGDTWNYYNKGDISSTNWKALSYDDSSWATGTAPFGYGGQSYGTVLGYGSDANNKVITYYFRKKINLKEVPSNVQFNFSYQIDDGFVVYVNGKEAGKYNISSNPSYSTFASTVATPPVGGTISVSSSMLQKGDNIIAVEVHNCSNGSSDIYWDGSLSYSSSGETTTVYSTEPEIEIPEHGNYTLEACFEKAYISGTFGKLRINEVSAANNIFVNEYYKKNDWIEIYNPTSSAIDINGYYLTNKEYIPDMYRISNQGGTVNTKVPAYGYLTIWCDKLEPINQLHSSFNLPAEGGKLILNSKLKNVVDSLTYPPHNGDESFGRYPDGTDSLYIFNLPTLGKDNRYSSYVKKVDASELTDAGAVLVQDETSQIDFYNTKDYLVLKLKGEPISVCVEIFNTSGMRVNSLNINLKSGGAMIGIKQLAAGNYVARCKTANGETYIRKFCK